MAPHRIHLTVHPIFQATQANCNTSDQVALLVRQAIHCPAQKDTYCSKTSVLTPNSSEEGLRAEITINSYQ